MRSEQECIPLGTRKLRSIESMRTCSIENLRRANKLFVLITDRLVKAVSCTFVKKKSNVEHYFEDEFDFWNDW